jgi:hypothetical protein
MIVRPEIREEIIRRFEAAFQFAGASSYDDAMWQFGKLLEFARITLEEVRTKEQFQASLDKLELSANQEKLMLAGSKFLPQIVRWGLSKVARAAAESLPAIPAGRPGVDFYTKSQVIAFIGKKHMRGYSLEQSKKSAAIHFGVSEGTVQRIWDDRVNIGEPDFRAVIKAMESES